MKEIYRLGIDLAKQNFELCGVSKEGRVVFRKSLKRSKVLEFMANLTPTIVCMEACGGANYWARKFMAQGHRVVLVPAQHVKAFLKSQKNDANDALAITEAAARPTMSFVAIKESWQQDLQSVHRVRSRIVRNLLEVSNQLRGLLAEYGIVINEGVRSFKKSLQEILELENEDLNHEMRSLVAEVFAEYLSLERRKKMYDERLERAANENPVCQRLSALPGIGAMTSTAFVSHMGRAEFYKNGRQAAASLGLVPRQHSTGGKQKLGGITKRGDRYLRCLLVHGARAYVSAIRRRPGKTEYERKIKKMLETKHMNKVVVAVANRNARVMLAMIKSGEKYKVA